MNQETYDSLKHYYEQKQYKRYTFNEFINNIQSSLSPERLNKFLENRNLTWCFKHKKARHDIMFLCYKDNEIICPYCHHTIEGNNNPNSGKPGRNG